MFDIKLSDYDEVTCERCDDSMLVPKAPGYQRELCRECLKETKEKRRFIKKIQYDRQRVWRE